MERARTDCSRSSWCATCWASVLTRCSTVRVWVGTRTLLLLLAPRWAIEVTFENGKQLLGLEDAANQICPRPYCGQRPGGRIVVQPGSGWYHQVEHQWERFPDRPWYRRKKEPSFADMLSTLRRRHGKTFLRGHFRKAPPPEIRHWPDRFCQLIELCRIETDRLFDTQPRNRDINLLLSERRHGVNALKNIVPDIPSTKENRRIQQATVKDKIKRASSDRATLSIKKPIVLTAEQRGKPNAAARKHLIGVSTSVSPPS